MIGMKFLTFAALLFIVEGKPFYTTQPTRPRITIACVTLDACGIFGGVKVGNFRHPDNSNWFFTCYNDTKRQPECQQCAAPSLHFIEKCNMCLGEIDETKIAECPKVIKTIERALPPVTCLQTFCSDQLDGMYSVANDVTKFYHCSNQITYCKQCQAGLSFDQSCNQCVDPSHTTPPPTPTK